MLADPSVELTKCSEKARQACTTAWIASPEETISLLEEIIAFMEMPSRLRELPLANAVDSCPTIQQLRIQGQEALAMAQRNENHGEAHGASKGNGDVNEPSF